MVRVTFQCQIFTHRAILYNNIWLRFDHDKIHSENRVVFTKITTFSPKQHFSNRNFEILGENIQSHMCKDKFKKKMLQKHYYEN